MINILLLSYVTATEAKSCSRRRPCTAQNLRRSLNVIPQHHGHIFDSMSELLFMPARWTSFYEQQQHQLKNTHKRSAPGYDISEDDEKMELTFDLPGIRAGEVSLELQEEGKLLKVFGSRKYKRRGPLIKFEFDKMFRIDPAVLDVKRISASLSDGVLVVSAPKLKPDTPEERSIPIKVIEDGVQNDGVQNDGVKVLSDQLKNEGTEEKQDPIQTIEESTEEAKKTQVDGLEITEEEDIL